MEYELEKKRFPPVIVSVVVGFAGALFWLSPVLFGDYIKHGVDLVSHTRWSEQFAAALFEGVVRPQWLSEEGYGFGSPLFVGYSPAFYYVASVGQVLTGEVWAGMKLASFFFLAVCGAFVHLLLRGFVVPSYAILGTFATLGSPIIIVVLYNYTGLPAFASFGPLAAVLYFTFRKHSKNQPNVGLSISFFILTLTHILTAAMTAMVFGLALLIRAIFAKPNQRQEGGVRTLFGWSIWAAAGILMASFYLIPAVHTTLQEHFLLHEAHAAFIDWRRAFSLPVFTQFFHEIYWATFQWYIPVIYALGVLVIYYVIKVKCSAENFASKQLALLLTVAFVAFFFTTELSYLLWSSLSPLQVLQWPWRFLIPLGLVVPLGLVLAANEMNESGFLRFAAIACLMIGVLFSGAKIAQLVVDGHVVDLTDLRAPERSLSRHTGSLDSLLAYREEGGLQNECLNRKLVCEEEEVLSHRKSWIVTAASPTSIQLPVFSHPGWRVTINEEWVPMRHDPQTGLFRIDLAAGISLVVVEWKGVPVQGISNALSILVLLLVIGVSVFQRVRARAELR